jgi:hypothetical protein
MIPALEGLPQRAELEQTIKDRIVQRTGRRIRALKVEWSEGRIVISGYTPNYYLKQLALEGVLDVVGSMSVAPIEFNVQVTYGPDG